VPSVLLIADVESPLSALHADLEAAGAAVVDVATPPALVQAAVRHAPDVVMCWQPELAPDLFDALQQLRDVFPRPVLVFTNEVRVEAFERALQAGVSAWVVQGYAPTRLRALLLQALSRHRHEQAGRDAAAALARRYEERTLVDRAKGVLMRARQLDEEAAFRLLRETAMRHKWRIGQLAKQVLDTARDAEAVNRAGRLRMLSQQVVKLQAARVAAVQAQAAEVAQQQALQRADRLLAQLRASVSMPTFGDLVDGVADAVTSVRSLLSEPPARANLQRLDEQAQAWLRRAEGLTQALESARPSAALQVINLAGRQRMLSQRVAKRALLAALTHTPPADDGSAEEFEQALQRLEALPLGSAQTRALLAQAGQQWPRLCTAARRCEGAAQQQAVLETSESLLALLDELSGRYEDALPLMVSDATG